MLLHVANRMISKKINNWEVKYFNTSKYLNVIFESVQTKLLYL